jgi:hypothetical protein
MLFALVTSDSLVNFWMLKDDRLELLKDDRSATVSRFCGTVCEGVLHASLSLSEARTLSGRTLDLQAAYNSSLCASPLRGRLPSGSSMRRLVSFRRIWRLLSPLGHSRRSTDSADLPGLYG